MVFDLLQFIKLQYFLYPNTSKFLIPWYFLETVLSSKTLKKILCIQTGLKWTVGRGALRHCIWERFFFSFWNWVIKDVSYSYSDMRQSWDSYINLNSISLQYPINLKPYLLIRWLRETMSRLMMIFHCDGGYLVRPTAHGFHLFY